MPVRRELRSVVMVPVALSNFEPVFSRVSFPQRARDDRSRGRNREHPHHRCCGARRHRFRAEFRACFFGGTSRSLGKINLIRGSRVTQRVRPGPRFVAGPGIPANRSECLSFVASSVVQISCGHAWVLNARLEHQENTANAPGKISGALSR